MTREERAVAIAGLTFFMFALFVFLRDGSFVFPFPLNEFALLAVSFFFLIWHPRSGVLPYLFFFSAVSAVLGSVVFWETTLSVHELEKFLSYTVVDWARFTAALFLIAAMLVFLSAYRQWYFKMLIVAAIASFVYGWGFTIAPLYYLLITFGILTAISAIRPVKKPFQLIWVLYFILHGMQWLTVRFA